MIPKVGISLHLVKMHPNFHLSYGILIRKYKNVMITLQKEWDNPLKIRFCFQTGDKIVIYVSTRGHWDCTILQHHCTTFGFDSDYTEVLQGGTISMPTGRHVDSLYYNRVIILNLELVQFWLFLAAFGTPLARSFLIDKKKPHKTFI